MEIHRLAIVSVLVYLVLILCYILQKNGFLARLGLKLNTSFSEVYLDHNNNPPSTNNETEINIALVVCGDRYNESMNMIKSAIIFNQNQYPLKFIVIAEEQLKQNFVADLTDWQENNTNIFKFELHSPAFPSEHENQWKALFKPCSVQRLFFPSLLANIDSVLYVDTDIIFLSPVHELWSKFHKFNSSQFAGLAPEQEYREAGWYNRFAQHPYYGELGANTGTMLMNLTRMRDFKFEEQIMLIYKKYQSKIVFGDQDILNILFHDNPDRLYVFPCEWNYRPDHCMFKDVCEAPDGIKIIHGNRGYFHTQEQPIFSLFYKAVDEYTFGTDINSNFFQKINNSLVLPSESLCDMLLEKFLQGSLNYFKHK
ncbi:glucoside xylosyltransferase 2-like [Malaya genurostris]|uniref:glucoside xylosyltransferase 2-like n=1 Tax=Malaya genurostris TaxID=325434 RepID=UPI0026F39266|nr:glucoside xylosyltransferase 2-like [Malaya genurostris]